MKHTNFNKLTGIVAEFLCTQILDRQTSIQTDRQTDRHTDRQTDRQAYRQTKKQMVTEWLNGKIVGLKIR